MRRSLVPFVLLACLGACGDKDAEPVGDGGSGDDGGDDAGDSGDDGDSGGDSGDDGGGDVTNPGYEACAGGEEGEVESSAATVLSATITWTLEFDEDAEANDFVDCSYSRVYEGVQVRDLDYTCPDCDFIVSGEATMTEGLDDCYSQISSDPQETRTENWGISGDATLYRSGRDQFPLGELTTFEGGAVDTSIEVGWESESELTDGGIMLLSATGTMSWTSDDETQVDEPFGPRADAYACEWECNDPGDLELDYALAEGGTMPNVRLNDQCGEAVDLWDFHGSYLVLDTSQSDCGPCRSMAEGEEEFLNTMRGEGIPIRVITFMGNGLSEPYGTPDQATIDDWISEYGLKDPVFYDRGYAYSLFPDFIDGFSGESFGYPAWLLVDPDMSVFYGNVGFSDWETVADLIREDWSNRGG